MTSRALLCIAVCAVGCGGDPAPGTSDVDLGSTSPDQGPSADAMAPSGPDGDVESDATAPSGPDGDVEPDAMAPSGPDGDVEPDATPIRRPHPAGDHDFTLEMDDAMLGQTVQRTYSVYVPASYTGDTPTAMILNLHGGRGSAASSKLSSQMNIASDAEGYIVVYPEAVEDPRWGRRWSNGDRADPNKMGTGEDTRFLGLMIDALEARLHIDPAQIFVTGISNGGMMTYRLGCEMSDRIAAIAPVATSRMVDPCTPSKPISVIHFHGKADDFIPYEGGPSRDALPLAFRLSDDFLTPTEAITPFVSNRACPLDANGDPTTTILFTVPDPTADEPHAQCIGYGPCDAQSQAVLCTMKDGGHTWPGGEHSSQAPRFRALVGPISPHLNATEMMWEFFQRHPLTD